jgi:RNA polymerase sigma factor (sigma-70 family)
MFIAYKYTVGSETTAAKDGPRSRRQLRDALSQISVLGRYFSVNANEAVIEVASQDASFDIESLFRSHFDRTARIVARVVRDPARAEELAVEAFLRLWRNRQAHNASAEAWLYRTAVRLGLDELRRQTRRTRYESFLALVRGTPTPEELHSAAEERDRVRQVLSVLAPRQAELLLLRSQDLSYSEVAAALGIKPASLGTLLSRAQQSFRKEYIRRYGER